MSMGHRICGREIGMQQLRQGLINNTQELSQDIIDELDVIWREEVEEQLGFASYGALRDALAR